MKTLLTLAAALMAARLAAGTIAGRVTDASTGDGLPGVNVGIAGTARGTVTETDGRFRLTGLTDGDYVLTFSMVGYARVTASAAIAGDGESRLTIALHPLPIQTEPVVVTANRREQSLQDVPVSISTMDGAALSARNFITVDDALRYVPGVNLTEYQVNIRGSSGYSRGVGTRVLLLLDGMPFLTGDTGEINFETIPVGQVERIEVVKGASSALYGSSALGGVVNVITRPVPEIPETRVRLYGGLYSPPSFPQWDWKGGARLLDGEAVTHAFRAGGAGVMLYGSRMADDGYRQNDFRRRYSLYGKVRFQPGSDDELSLTGNFFHQRRGSFLYWRDLQHAWTPPDVQQGDIVSSTRFFVSGEYRRPLGEGLVFTSKAMWFRNRWNDTIDTLTNVSRSDVLRADVQATWLASRMQILTFGAEGNVERVDADLFGHRRGGGGALFLQDEITPVEGLTLTLGLRWDGQDRDSLEANSQWNPKAGIVYTPFPGTALRASYGRGFRTPSVAEAFVVTQAGGLDIIPNPALRPERSSSYEAGVSTLFGESALLDLAVFQSDFRDLIEPRFVQVGGLLKGQFNNVTRARVQGIEGSIKAGLFSQRLLLDAGYTYVYPRDLGLNDLLKYRPRHLLYAGFTAHTGVITTGADFRYLSRVERIDEEFGAFVNDAGARVAITVLDVRLGVDVALAAAPLTITLNVKNLLQYNYTEFLGNLAPPRTYVLSCDASL